MIITDLFMLSAKYYCLHKSFRFLQLNRVLTFTNIYEPRWTAPIEIGRFIVLERMGATEINTFRMYSWPPRKQLLKSTSLSLHHMRGELVTVLSLLPSSVPSGRHICRVDTDCEYWQVAFKRYGSSSGFSTLRKQFPKAWTRSFCLWRRTKNGHRPLRVPP